MDMLQLEASIYRDSLWDFVQHFWDVVIAEPLESNWHMEEICKYLQEMGERAFRAEDREWDLCINIPPGTSKSTIVSVMFPAWCWTRMPSFKIISVSHTYKLATFLSRKSRDILESEKFRRLFGDVGLREDQNSKDNYENVHGGFRFAIGMDGKVIGRHAHAIIIDDPIDPEGTTGLELETANRVVRETLPLRVVNKKVSFTVLVMQRLHQQDPTSILLDESRNEKHGTKTKHICLPGEIDDPSEVKPRKLARMYRKGLLDPRRLSRKALDAARARLGEYGYACQIKQNPIPRQGGMFKVDKITIDTPPLIQHMRALRYWDKAATQDGGKYTAGVLVGVDRSGVYWILDVVRGQLSSDRREALIKLTAEVDGKRIPVGIEQEPGSGGKDSALYTLQNLAGWVVTLDRPTGDKALRADPLSAQVNGGNVKMKKGPWNSAFISEMEHFPNSKFKDQVDAASGAFNLLSKPQKKVGGWF